jgi:two-component system, NtrC family, response regulator AtoC
VPTQTTTVDQHDGDGGGERRQLVIATDDGVKTIALPKAAKLTVGRSTRCDVHIDDDSVSREHAVLYIGEQLEIEDLGSRNRVFVGDRRLEARGRVAFRASDVVRLGTVTLVVRAASPAIRAQHIWPHGYFEGQVEHECARSLATGRSFVLLRLQCGATARPEVIERTLTETLRPFDVLGVYAPNDYEVLLVETDPEPAAELERRLVEALAARGAIAHVGRAVFPRDGASASPLMARVQASLRGEPQNGRGAGGRDTAPRPASMRTLAELVERVAPRDIDVLILGETGAGKEVTARAIHRASARAAKPFVSLNCAALAPSLVESELFGHERGAFTGATAAKQGLLEVGHGGTVFLDEIGELPEPMQVKLLRVLDERMVLRVGAVKPRRIDVRFISATNRDLEQEIERGRFRSDLYFRLNGVSLVVPPLRERVGEIAKLATAFAADAARRFGVRPPAISPAAVGELEAYAWPGNVRELRNTIERATALCRDERIEPADLPLEKMRAIVTTRRPRTEPNLVLAGLSPDELVERERIVEALRTCGGNQTRAAKVLGFSVRKLIYRLERYDLPRPLKSPKERER